MDGVALENLISEQSSHLPRILEELHPNKRKVSRLATGFGGYERTHSLEQHILLFSVLATTLREFISVSNTEIETNQFFFIFYKIVPNSFLINASTSTSTDS